MRPVIATTGYWGVCSRLQTAQALQPLDLKYKSDPGSIGRTNPSSGVILRDAFLPQVGDKCFGLTLSMTPVT